MEHQYGITRPGLFTFDLGGGKSSRGADPEWYRDEGQREAGGGAAAAAMLLAYLSAARPELAALYPSGSRSRADFLPLMERVWEHAASGKMGVNSLHLFSNGMKSFARERKCTLHVRELDIPRLHLARPSFSQCAAFLRTGLAADCPVAFLHYSYVLIPHLENFHWALVVSMEEKPGGQVVCTVLEEGRERKTDFRLWYQAPHTGGGLLYIPEERKT